MVFVFSGRRLKVVVPYAARQILPQRQHNFAKQNTTDFNLYRRLRRHFVSAANNLSRHLFTLFTNDTSPRRRTPPLRQTMSATSPVSSGEPTPKGKARSYSF